MISDFAWTGCLLGPCTTPTSAPLVSFGKSHASPRLYHLHPRLGFPVVNASTTSLPLQELQVPIQPAAVVAAFRGPLRPAFSKDEAAPQPIVGLPIGPAGKHMPTFHFRTPSRPAPRLRPQHSTRSRRGLMTLFASTRGATGN